MDGYLFIGVCFVILCIYCSSVQWVDDFKDGYRDCKMSYSIKREVMPYEHPQNRYEHGWNKAVKEIAKENNVNVY